MTIQRHAAALEDEYRRMERPSDVESINTLPTQQANISQNNQQPILTMNEQEPQSSADSAQIPHDSLKSLSVMKILKL